MTETDKKKQQQHDWEQSVHMTKQQFQQLLAEKLQRAHDVVGQRKRLEGYNLAR
jgi:hypothetical protein